MITEILTWFAILTFAVVLMAAACALCEQADGKLEKMVSKMLYAVNRKLDGLK